MEIPVYLLTGFLDSGKSTFITDTLKDSEFSGGEKTLLLLCEEGETEYSEALLASCGTKMCMVENEEGLTLDFLMKCQKKYSPTQIVIEYNGMWSVEKLLGMQLPKDWEFVQIITLINAATFTSYINNMRSIMAEQFKHADTVIFNRCDKNTNQSYCKRNIKAVSRRTQIYFEMADKSPMPYEEEELPFDVTAPVIEIEDDDFGIWYLDAVDHGEKYVGKVMSFRGMVYRSQRFLEGEFVPGRFAMTCCADDTAFIGFLCKSEDASALKNRQWVKVIAEVKLEYQKEYKGDGPVLYAKSIEPAQEPEEKLVYFN